MKRFVMAMTAAGVMVAAPVAQSLQTEEVFDVVAMPLAVAAVSEVSGVPAGDLTQLVKAMNETDVAPAHFVEIVRHSPVLLIEYVNGPQIVTSVMNEVERGITGDELVLSLQKHIRARGIEDFDVSDRSRVIVDRQVVVPERVMTRVDEMRDHPHGGPPGQIKKEIGVQTGAEVVHGAEPGSSARSRSDRDQTKQSGAPPHADKRKARAKDKNRGDR